MRDNTSNICYISDNRVSGKFTIRLCSTEKEKLVAAQVGKGKGGIGHQK